jgi:small subunit ribosomal protein S17
MADDETSAPEDVSAGDETEERAAVAAGDETEESAAGAAGEQMSQGGAVDAGEQTGQAAAVTAGDQATPAGAGRPNRRKVREGLVVSVAMDKTAVIGVIERVRHPRYAKTVQRTKRLYADDPNNDLRVGDRVRLAETRPLSKLKRWRVVDVLERAR